MWTAPRARIESETFGNIDGDLDHQPSRFVDGCLDLHRVERQMARPDTCSRSLSRVWAFTILPEVVDNPDEIDQYCRHR
jgi:hypothetical protein